MLKRKPEVGDKIRFDKQFKKYWGTVEKGEVVTVTREYFYKDWGFNFLYKPGSNEVIPNSWARENCTIMTEPQFGDYVWTWDDFKEDVVYGRYITNYGDEYYHNHIILRSDTGKVDRFRNVSFDDPRPKEEPVTELTLSEVAELAGVSVDKLRIKD